jgi:hypothetical protein
MTPQQGHSVVSSVRNVDIVVLIKSSALVAVAVSLVLKRRISAFSRFSVEVYFASGITTFAVLVATRA